MKFRGNDRRLLRKFEKACDQIIARDVKWAARNEKTSSLADVAILPAADTALRQAFNTVHSRISVLLAQ